MKRLPRAKPFGKKGLGLLGLLLASGLGSAISGAVQMAMMVGTVIMPIIIGVVAFKAIIVAVMAFVLSGVAGFKNMMAEDKPEVVKIVTRPIEVPHPHQNSRSVPMNWATAPPPTGGTHEAQNIAYSSYVPVIEQPIIHR